jgi:hypothetical protein
VRRCLLLLAALAVAVPAAGCKGEVLLDVHLRSGERGTATVSFGIDQQLAQDQRVRDAFDSKVNAFGAAEGWAARPVERGDGWRRVEATHEFADFDELRALLTSPYRELQDQPLARELDLRRQSGFLRQRYKLRLVVDHSVMASGLVAAGEVLARDAGQPEPFVQAVRPAVEESFAFRHRFFLPGSVSKRTGVAVDAGDPSATVSFAPPVTERAEMTAETSRLKWGNINGVILGALVALCALLFTVRAVGVRRARRRAGGS